MNYVNVYIRFTLDLITTPYIFNVFYRFYVQKNVNHEQYNLYSLKNYMCNDENIQLYN